MGLQIWIRKKKTGSSESSSMGNSPADPEEGGQEPGGGNQGSVLRRSLKELGNRRKGHGK